MLKLSLKPNIINDVQKRHNLTFGGLAAALDVPPYQLTELGQGSEIPQNLLAKLAAITGLPLDDLATVTSNEIDRSAA
ncbi:hypothetical protein HHJ81_03670 [Mobiluncus mulieris]|uniref:hypothetical protein n=1 Tax=Mobiluncus mulieris TaxID=2052 RepID=UPI0014703F55|nr:hypothetical protein [Mobiluncus mulieris]MCU9995378.1 hypothetical protein [Mobiluncus mulieris]NMW60202.1 hypothetical protein [Mobiluncus mulieris]